MMKKVLLSLFLSTGFIFTINSHAAWLKNYDQAIKKAKSENKVILADVSGQNWCIWCKRLDQEVFDTSEFKSFARKNLILLLIDVPSPSNPSAEAKTFMKKYPVNGYPTVFLLDEDGKILLKTGYQRGGPQNYIKSLMPFIKKSSPDSKKMVTTGISKPETETTSEGENVSQKSKEEIAEIDSIIDGYIQKGEDIEDSFIRENIISDINEKLPLKKDFKPNKINDIEITELAAKLTEKEFPKELTHLKKEYQKQAEEKYHTAKIKEKVNVKFKLGTSVFTADGIFRGYTTSGNGVIIGRHKIAFFDLLPESKCLFSSKLCKEMQDEYVKEQITLYLKKKNFFSKQQRESAKSQLIKQNEEAGYILYNDQWLTPEKIGNSLIDKKIDLLSDSEQPESQKYEEEYEESFEYNNNDPQQEIQRVLQNFNPLVFIPIVILMSIFGVCSFICLIVSFVRMFQNGKTAIGIICIILSIFSGIGPLIAFIYCWTKVREFGISKLMKFWTLCFILNIILMIVLFWQFFAVIAPLISNYQQF